MPYKFEVEHKKLPRHLDRRIKLTPEDKIEIENLLSKGVAQNEIARIYGVSRKSIYYIKYPERKKADAELRKILAKDGRYYDKEKHREAIKKTRSYKQKNKDLLIN